MLKTKHHPLDSSQFPYRLTVPLPWPRTRYLPQQCYMTNHFETQWTKTIIDYFPRVHGAAGQFCQPGPVLAVPSRLPRASTVSGMFPRGWPAKDGLSCSGLALLHVASDLLEANLGLFSWLRKISEGEGTSIPRSVCFHQVFFFFLPKQVQVWLWSPSFQQNL